MRPTWLALFCALFLALPGARALPNDPVISTLYARALAGDRAAVTECIAALEKVLAGRPDDQLARVYLGSSYTLRSRDLAIGPAKLSALRKGIALMDEAAAAAPGNADVQLNRAVTNQALPAFLGRRKIAREQLERLLAQVEKNPDALTPADRQLLYLNAGEAAARAGETARAQELWQRGAALQGDPRLSREIASAIAAAVK
ncbi:MAG: hypothetical protein M3Q86_04345 [Verrucomicrobiota bacterium]|nr:hypothetical protein [Verrucomicrobiota bacterium]